MDGNNRIHHEYPCGIGKSHPRGEYLARACLAWFHTWSLAVCLFFSLLGMTTLKESVELPVGRTFLHNVYDFCYFFKSIAHFKICRIPYVIVGLKHQLLLYYLKYVQIEGPVHFQGR